MIEIKRSKRVADAVAKQNDKDGKYRGKPDTRPWNNAPPAGFRGLEQSWSKGDHATWENQVRTRSAGRNENRRIGH